MKPALRRRLLAVLAVSFYVKKHDADKAAADYAEAERSKPSDDRYR